MYQAKRDSVQKRNIKEARKVNAKAMLHAFAITFGIYCFVWLAHIATS